MSGDGRAKHVLVATDFSKPAKQMTANLEMFAHYGVERATLVHVQNQRLESAKSESRQGYYRTLLDEQADTVRELGWDVDLRTELGRPAHKIAEIAEEIDTDLVAVANKGRSGMGDMVLGSVATGVLEQARRAVFLFCSDDATPGRLRKSPWEYVIHPTDFSEASDAALRWVHDWFVPRAKRVVLVHAVDDRYSGPEHRQKMREKLDDRRERLVDAQSDRVETQLAVGRPKKIVDDVISRYPGALVVMGTHGRDWFRDLILGGVARSVARRGTHHVLFAPGGEREVT